MFNESLRRKQNVCRAAILFYNGIIKHLKLYIVILALFAFTVEVRKHISKFMVHHGWRLYILRIALHREHYKNKYHVRYQNCVHSRDDTLPKTLIQYGTLSFHVDADIMATHSVPYESNLPFPSVRGTNEIHRQGMRLDLFVRSSFDIPSRQKSIVHKFRLKPIFY